jgi:hypothetical protein
MLAALGVVGPMSALASVGGSGGAAGAAIPHVSLSLAPAKGRVLYNVPPMLGSRLTRLGLGRLRNMSQVTSTNWSGYVDTQDTFQSVTGSWTEPTVSCTPSSGGGGGLLGLGAASPTDTADYSSFWVGLDGDTSSTVEQIGTSADCLNSGAASYYAWYEMYPAGENQLTTATTYKVDPGDTITGTVSSTSPDAFTLTLSDKQQGWTESLSESGSNLARSSAEWIAEAPSACSILFCSGLPLANFGTVNFAGAGAENTVGSSGSIAGFTDNEVTMQSDGTINATPTPLVKNGTGFSVNWQNS